MSPRKSILIAAAFLTLTAGPAHAHLRDFIEHLHNAIRLVILLRRQQPLRAISQQAGPKWTPRHRGESCGVAAGNNPEHRR